VVLVLIIIRGAVAVVVVIIRMRGPREALLVQRDERVGRLHPQVCPCVARLPRAWVQQEKV
jgi:hypothetical protein